ncbi:hypothetical protein A3D81_00570 [Candidatus Curtissbacteria bacterium RIFCSPHIGHO2_02_FULL_40_17]|uniref:Methyltransferase FkbM domain-containing protein n=4 Tax=Candidatus Curtissiibacteriota TaxID=1752717 RepID=A0A1F5GIC8_9BACT|nr:MAG: hypothetical protein A2693_01760 [Candidatus Curtissbacteria bacterium RIFCSPHIGHO2_01_FULL_40_12]OGD91589.1 MAG: hypothetical protein A3D81_00570 [Candidatus Curtissbacteria bacterium RIFCSPHIGHO2_02_FULL_40_17]OGE03444.1 MAG: hypothetical protein A3F45_04400 [Candidatus Curtissbacteria bacterium RIFCSPHIGHO2_12_FULL_41_17]OGE07893.1 MAG: hypothetical protein A3I53_04415 [Candidatus Curtissbacteria bacterium RIFCSPLOWO2_02_FULL_40_13b]
MKGQLFVLLRRLNVLFHKSGLRVPKIFFPLYWFVFEKVKETKPMLVRVGGVKLLGYPWDTLFSDMIVRGMEEFETDLFRKYLKHGMTVVDIGANIGLYTLISAKKVGTTGKVYSFEPERINYGLLLENIKLNKLRNVFPYQMAVADKTEKRFLAISKFNLGGHSLSQGNVQYIKGRQKTSVVSLDYFFNKVEKIQMLNVIKMDTQGAEGLIMEGAKRVLRRFHPKIFMEFWPGGLRNMGTDPVLLLKTLKSFGYKIKHIDEQNKTLNDVTIKEVISLSSRQNWTYLNLFLE